MSTPLHRCKALLALLLLPALAQASGYVFVQAATPVDSTGVSTKSISLAGVTVGDLLIASFASNRTFSTVAEGTDTVVTAVAAGAADLGNLGIYAINAGTTTPTVTFTVTGGTGEILLTLEEWSPGSGGTLPVTLVDHASAIASSASGTTATTAALTPSAAGDLAYSVGHFTPAKTITWAGGYVDRTSTTGSNFLVQPADQVLASTSAVTASASWTGSAGWGIAQVLFNAPTGAGGGCTHAGWNLSNGSFSTPASGSGSFWHQSGATGSVDCSSANYYQQSGAFGAN